MFCITMWVDNNSGSMQKAYYGHRKENNKSYNKYRSYNWTKKVRYGEYAWNFNKIGAKKFASKISANAFAEKNFVDFKDYCIEEI